MVSRTETIERDNVVVSLTLDRTTVETGGVIRARATVLNAGSGPVTWADLGCFNIQLFDREAPEVPQPPPGKTWPGMLELVKVRATNGVGPGGFMPPAVLEPEFELSCTGDDRRAAELRQGASMSIDMVWQALMTHRLPAPAGEYRAIFQFPFLGRLPVDQFSGDPMADMSWIKVGVPFEVVGEPFAGIPPTIAVDRALADARVSTWLEAHTRQELGNVGIGLMGDRWLLIAETWRGGLRVEIRATDGAILRVDTAD
jgi:hypothetical protein